MTTKRPREVGGADGTRPAACACCGARIMLSCGARTSRAALRTIRQMNR
jgi:hypothetical protein